MVIDLVTITFKIEIDFGIPSKETSLDEYTEWIDGFLDESWRNLYQKWIFEHVKSSDIYEPVTSLMYLPDGSVYYIMIYHVPKKALINIQGSVHKEVLSDSVTVCIIPA